jgi:hypothetical protein
MAEEQGRKRLTPIRSCDEASAAAGAGLQRPAAACRRGRRARGLCEPRMGFAVNNVLGIHT